MVLGWQRKGTFKKYNENGAIGCGSSAARGLGTIFYEDWSIDVGRALGVKPLEDSDVNMQVFHGAPKSRTQNSRPT